MALMIICRKEEGENRELTLIQSRAKYKIYYRTGNQDLKLVDGIIDENHANFIFDAFLLEYKFDEDSAQDKSWTLETAKADYVKTVPCCTKCSFRGKDGFSKDFVRCNVKEACVEIIDAEYCKYYTV